ncbi:hypothetical protein MHU86_5413 [Fragilaria crotonensis]|nr:hypothetical protein MHU86_5413 [Fragilaria crotonensis]
MSDKGIHTVLFRAVMLLRADDTYGPRMSNCWLPAATWVEAIRKSGHIDGSLIIDVRKFNTAMSKSSLFGELMTRFDGSNATGVFRINYQHQYFYYFTDETRQVAYPRPLNGTWKERVLQHAANVLVIPSTRGRPSTVENAPVLPTTRVGHPGTNENENASPLKRQRVDNVAQSPSCLYWPESPEAYQLIRPREYNGGAIVDNTDTTNLESPQEALERRIIQLQAVHESKDSWRAIVKGGDPDNICTKAEVFEIRQRAIFLCLAYQLALTNMNEWTWHHCCKVACQTLNSLGMHQATFLRPLHNGTSSSGSSNVFPTRTHTSNVGSDPCQGCWRYSPMQKTRLLLSESKT